MTEHLDYAEMEVRGRHDDEPTVFETAMEIEAQAQFLTKFVKYLIDEGYLAAKLFNSVQGDRQGDDELIEEFVHAYLEEGLPGEDFEGK